jgi:peptidoglycan/LPS O-acetylase OafA/YrhL
VSPTKGIGRARLGGIESLRAYAAIAIVMTHLVSVGHAAIPESLDFIRTRFGLGVPLFFAVSGFSMAYGYWGRLADEASIKEYFIRRFTRIAPLFYFMLVFNLIYLYFEAGVTFSPVEVLLNAMFVFNVIPHMTDGIVPASWSIGVEMVFYAIFPLMLMINRSIVAGVLLLVLSIAMATHFSMDMETSKAVVPSFIYHNFLTNFPYFMWGILGYHIYIKVIDSVERGRFRYISYALCVVALLTPIFLYKDGPLFNFFLEKNMRTTWATLWGVPLCMVCIAMALHPSRLLSNPLTRYLGMISFSLYLVHPSVLYKLGQAGLYNWVLDLFNGRMIYAYAFSLVISMLIITAISVLTYRFIEKPGMNWGKRITTPKSTDSVLST